MPAAIEVVGLTKRFGALVAVDGVSFDVPAGSLFGLLGPNGSGKTTTLGMLTGLVPPDGGSARVLGFDVGSDAQRALSCVGALIEEPAFYPYMSGRDNLRLVARLLDLDEARADAALQRAGLAEAASRKYKGYSQGMRRRLGLAAALVGDAPLIILDEPTHGLDPAGQLEVRALLHHIARVEGRTVVVSSHLLHEVQDLCTHVAVLHKGKLLATGPLDDILRGGAEEVRVEVDDVERARAIVAAMPGVGGVTVEGGALRIAAPRELASDVNRALVTGGVRVHALSASRPALEERFLDLTQEAP